MISTCDELEGSVAIDENEPLISGPSSSPPRAKVLNDPAASEPPSEQLAARAQGGCHTSFEALVSRHERQIFNFIYQFTQHRQDAEDLTQETFLKAYRSLPRYQAARAFAPWLFTIARRTAASHFRAAKSFEELKDDGEAVRDNPANLLESADEQKSLWQLARMLKAKQFEVLWLRYHEGFSIAETAAVMRTNQIYVKVLLHRARASLAAMLATRGATAGRKR
jgi:RNA polymerase sigma-70 factor (ECF subfamily)